MQAKKAPVIRPARRSELRILDRFCRGIGLALHKCAKNVFVLDIPGGSYLDAFDLPRTLEPIIKLLGGRAYAAGYYLGKIFLGRGTFLPAPTLAHRLATLGANTCILDEHGERLFLYGRDIKDTHIVGKSLPGNLKICIVLNINGEALGWGSLVSKPSKGGSRALVRPVWDLGWYLRRGG